MTLPFGSLRQENTYDVSYKAENFVLLSGIVTARWNTLERKEGIHDYVCVLKRCGSCCSTGTSKGTQVHVPKNRAYFCV